MRAGTGPGAELASAVRIVLAEQLWSRVDVALDDLEAGREILFREQWGSSLVPTLVSRPEAV